MPLLRQFALAALLVAGTAIAVVAYLDVQAAGPTARSGSGTPILEFGPHYPMTRPLRVPTAGPSDRARRPDLRAATPEEPAQWVHSSARRARREAPAAAPEPGVFLREVEVEIRSASSLPAPALR